MMLIAHRGNTEGPNKSKENTEEYLKTALSNNFWIEVDVWEDGNSNDTVMLGHDKPEHKSTFNFLKSDPRIICHAKTAVILEKLLKHEIHCFSHDKDNCVLTSCKYIWTYPGHDLTKSSIAVMPEWIEKDYKKWLSFDCKGICSDFVGKLI